MNNLKINLHITEHCNFTCRYCFAPFNHRADLPIENWKKVINDLKSDGNISAINFAGGEPLLCELPQLVEVAAS
ncbi:MAG: radical SAM protein [Synergistaceae bacterium]|nr:radical SAM protein [Synergistaceae bacterium]MBQ6737360.1 radical SAM protein [Synergistaceae bacterium]MBQ7068971.1 radical SAM protein [Synergistaceae bacterium]MBR0234317.1 radical SAM protein [Synergistaceae bacterium]MBR0253508.1 radical SAM protein [Synergistaceae bacterium]